MLHVYLGRFAPFHEGHRMLLTKLINRFGAENCLVLIGSANVLDTRTPFKFERRKEMIKEHFPHIQILPLDDVFSDEVWLGNISRLENKLAKKFVFYGGSSEDLKILAKKFETHVLVDRFKEGKGISATKIRENLKKTDLSGKQ